MSESEDIQKLGKLIKDIKIAMLTTVDADGSLRSRPMATQQTEFDGKLWFFTDARSPKTGEVESESQVNVSYANPSDNRYVSVSGLARVMRDPTKAEELWSPILKAWFPQGLEDPNLALLEIDVERAEYWDSPSSTVVQLAGFVKALTTGKPYQPGPGEHQKVELHGRP